jgi:hypothetical protein
VCPRRLGVHLEELQLKISVMRIPTCLLNVTPQALAKLVTDDDIDTLFLVIKLQAFLENYNAPGFLVYCVLFNCVRLPAGTNWNGDHLIPGK